VTNHVNYLEGNSEDEEANEMSIAKEVVKEVIENLDIGSGSGLQINKKKQYKKIYETSLSRDDWEIDNSKSLPKGNEQKDCYYFYLRFHPGVYKMLIRDIIKILNDDFDMKLKSGRPERFGNATIKSICNFKRKIGEREKNLQICFYHTTNSLDLKITGNPRNALEKFKDLGFKNGSFFFIEDVVPEVIKRIFTENNMETTKQYWGNLANEGYLQEVNREAETANDSRNKKAAKKVTKAKPKHKCGHCQKMIGQKVALQCESCDNLNLVEC
jgi:hypothetical protein